MTNTEQPVTSARRRWGFLLALPVLVTVLTYLWYDSRFPSWTEDVLLPDGRKIKVKQRRDFVEGYGTRRTWLKFSLPEMGGEQTWEQWLYPTMIGALDGKAYVMGRPRGDKQFLLYGYPKYTYVAFQWQNDGFVRVPYMSVPETLRRTENVRWCFPGGDDSKNDAAGSEPHEWCRWPKPHGATDFFARPREVDLSIRIEEATFWARISGNRPSTD